MSKYRVCMGVQTGLFEGGCKQSCPLTRAFFKSDCGVKRISRKAAKKTKRELNTELSYQLSRQNFAIIYVPIQNECQLSLCSSISYSGLALQHKDDCTVLQSGKHPYYYKIKAMKLKLGFKIQQKYGQYPW